MSAEDVGWRFVRIERIKNRIEEIFVDEEYSEFWLAADVGLRVASAGCVCIHFFLPFFDFLLSPFEM